MTRMIFVRHGESQANLEAVFAGNYNPYLTERGRMQARRAAEALKDTHIDVAYASDLIRAYETGEIVAAPHGLTPIPDQGLREIFGGEWEALPFCELNEKYPEDYAVWCNDLANARPTGGESVRELSVRLKETCERIARKEEGKTVLVALHATPIRVMQLHWEGRPVDDIAEIPWVINASISIADFDGEKWTPVVIGESKHLAGLETYLPSNI